MKRKMGTGGQFSWKYWNKFLTGDLIIPRRTSGSFAVSGRMRGEAPRAGGAPRRDSGRLRELSTSLTSMETASWAGRSSFRSVWTRRRPPGSSRRALKRWGGPAGVEEWLVTVCDFRSSPERSALISSKVSPPHCRASEVCWSPKEMLLELSLITLHYPNK